MASALENYVNNVRTLSASGNFRDLAEHLNETVELLTKNWSILDNVLETLDMQQHSLGVLYVLIAKFNSISMSHAVESELLPLMREFVHLCNGEQVRFATHAYYELCHMFTNFMVESPNCNQCIEILGDAIEKIRLFESQLTAVHADLCLISLKALNFQRALGFLDVDINAISTASDTMGQTPADVNNDSKYFLLYYYYGGMIYTAVRNYERGLYFFEVCVTTPATAMSHIMLEAYKKYILVSLIVHGKLLPMPKYASQVVTRFMKPMSIGYHEVANAFLIFSSADRLQCAIQKYSDTFTRDNNMGLVKQVTIAMYKKNIKRLTKTFLTLSLADVASRVHLPNAAVAEKYIVHMISAEEIHAIINQKDGMVFFNESPEKYNTPEKFLHIQEEIKQVKDLAKQIVSMEEEIMMNPMYIKKTLGCGDDDVATQQGKTFAGDPMVHD